LKTEKPSGNTSLTLARVAGFVFSSGWSYLAQPLQGGVQLRSIRQSNPEICFQTGSKRRGAGQIAFFRSALAMDGELIIA
jgi:hypothetical protein